MHKLSLEFYLNPNVQEVAQQLLGKMLYTQIDGKLCSGKIVETEAYQAPEDKASHAYANKKTPRTDTFYLQGGVAYVYLCYGIHSLFNVITNVEHVPHAVLIRAIEPILGKETMLKRRKKTKLDYTITKGPGALAQAMGITRLHNNLSLLSDIVWISKDDKEQQYSIESGARVGVGYAQEYAEMPWRYWVAENPYVSRK